MEIIRSIFNDIYKINNCPHYCILLIIRIESYRSKLNMNNKKLSNLDFLIINAPPGTSDEHITIAQNLKTSSNNNGRIIITTLQEVSLLAVSKNGLIFVKKLRYQY